MKTLIISTGLLGIYITLDLILNDQMWKANTKLTLYLQNHQFSQEKNIMDFFSDWLYIFPGIGFCVFIFKNNKLDAILYGCMIVFIGSLNGILKNIYHQARPFWIVEEIKGLQCNKEFGKPSGHAMGSSTMLLLLPFILFPNLWNGQQSHDCNIKKYMILIKIVFLSVVILWTFITGFSRVFLGVHSFGQIILGWVYSVYVMINYMKYLHNPISIFIKTSLKQSGAGITWILIFKVGFVMLIYILISFLFYSLNEKDVIIKKQEAIYFLQMIKHNCKTPSYSLENPNVLQNNCFNNSLQILFIYFLLISAKLSNGTYTEGKFQENFCKLKWYYKIYRIAVLFMLLLILSPFIFFITTKTLITTIISQTIPIYLIVALILFYVYPKFLKYLGLNLEGDLIYIDNQINRVPEQIITQSQNPHLKKDINEEYIIVSIEPSPQQVPSFL